MRPMIHGGRHIVIQYRNFVEIQLGLIFHISLLSTFCVVDICYSKNGLSRTEPSNWHDNFSIDLLKKN